MSSTTPTLPGERIGILDVLRGIAIFGILIGNMQWFSGYGFMPPEITLDWAVADKAAQFLVHFFIEGKFYSIFSFLFGYGFAIQIAKADERGDTGAALFKRRLVWLLVIGLLHAYLLWYGDILSVYAAMGFLLVLFRKKPTEALLKWAIVLMVFPVIFYLFLYTLFIAFVPQEALASIGAAQTEMWTRSMGLVPGGGWFEIFKGHNMTLIVGRYAGLIFEMRLPKVLAMFLLGLYAHRKGYFNDLAKHRTFVTRVAVYGLILGLIGNIAFAALAGKEAVLPPTPAGIIGVISYAFGVPALALFYIAAVALLWQSDRMRRLLNIFAPVGQLAMTNYLLQTLVCVFIFYGYGFGLYGSVRPSYTIAIAATIFLFQIIFSAVWLRWFRFGPMEWIWRQLTYKKRLTLTRQPVASSG